MESEYVEDFLVTTRQFAEADIVLLGTIEKVDAARWNSPDGKEWKPADTIAEPMPYTTIYVAPSEIVKGNPKFGTPVAVRFAGGAVGPNSQAMSAQIGLPDLEVGTEVLVFGKDEQRYGPGAVYTPAGYWLLSDMHSLFQRDGAQYLSVAGVRKADTGIVNLEELRRMAGK
ncbi:MAG: hypothetical protein M0Z94_04315 [Dehalococcoidales bacterium]|nr:hypothetical protein [Dehalococcoidales bacterium]